MRVLPGVALVLLGVAAAGWLALPPDRGTVAHSRTERASAMPVLNVNRRGTGFVARGSVPDTGTLSRLQAEGVTGLRLASGAPDAAWTQAVLAGLTGLRHLEVGQFELRDRRLSFLGTATTPVEGAALEHAVTAALPSGFTATYALGFRDDLQPVAYRVHYDVVGGTDLVGKLPVGTSATDIAHALGLDDLDDGAQVAVQGAQGAPSPALAVLRDWLGVVETLDVTVDADSTHVRMSLGAAWDLEAVHQELALGLPDKASPSAEKPLSVITPMRSRVVNLRRSVIAVPRPRLDAHGTSHPHTRPHTRPDRVRR